MDVPSIHVHRLGVNEVGRIAESQDFSPGLRNRFRNHNRWLKQVIGELKRGQRIAFGAFVDGGSQVDDLVGTLILKRGHSGTIEAKNFLVRSCAQDGTRKPISAESIHKIILRKAEAFCRIRGFSQIDIEIFVHETDEGRNSQRAIHSEHVTLPINALLSEHFNLVSIRPSTLFPSDTFYTFSKKLRPSYTGDFDDHTTIVRWVLQESLGFTNLSPPRNHHSGTSNDILCQWTTFTVPFPANSFQIKGVCVVDFGEDGDHEYHHDLLLTAASSTDHHGAPGDAKHPSLEWALLDANIRLLVSFREKSYQTDDRRIWVINSDQINHLLGFLPHAAVKAEDIGGVIIEIEQKGLEPYIKQSRPFGYYVASGLGLDIHSRFNDAPQDEKPELYAVLASLDRVPGGARNAVVWGVARILDIKSSYTDTAFYDLEQSQRLWSHEEFAFYVNEFTLNYQYSDSIYILELGPPMQFASPVELSAVYGPQHERSHELGVTTSYINNKAVRSLRRKAGAAFSMADTLASSAANLGEPSYPNAFFIELAKALRTLQNKHRSLLLGKTVDLEEDSTRFVRVLMHLVDRDEAGTESVNDVHPSKNDHNQLRLFGEPDPGKLLSKVKDAHQQMAQAKGDDIVRLAWRLRFETRKLLDYVLPLLPQRSSQFSLLLPNPSEVKKKIRAILMEYVLPLFRAEEDPNARVAHRKRIMEQRLEIDFDILGSSILGIPDNKEFVYKLVDEISGSTSKLGKLVAVLANSESTEPLKQVLIEIAIAIPEIEQGLSH